MTTDKISYADIGPDTGAGAGGGDQGADKAAGADVTDKGQGTDAPKEGAADQGADKKPNSDAADGGDKDADKGDKAKDGDGKDDPKAPVEYADFTLPEGFDVDTDMLTKFKASAKASGLTQEAAQQLMDIHVENMTKVINDGEFRGAIYAQEHAAKLKTWEKQVMDDPEVGGEKSPEALSKALAAVEALDKEVPGLAALVKDAGIGFGSNVLAVRFFAKLGNRIKASGSFPSGGNGGGEKSAAQILYPDA